MPGPISDSFDPEFGTAAKAAEIEEALAGVYAKLSSILGQQEPIYILDLVRAELPAQIYASLSEREWRLLRFAVERARETI